MSLKRVANILALCLCLTGIAFGQETTGTIEGTVVDAQGGRIAGATVVVEGNAFNRTVTTDSDGFYRILQVPPGTYSITTQRNQLCDRQNSGRPSHTWPGYHHRDQIERW